MTGESLWEHNAIRRIKGEYGMNPASALAATLGFRPEYRLPEKLPTGVAALDALIQGFPRGAISEIAGPESSGRATLVQCLYWLPPPQTWKSARMWIPAIPSIHARPRQAESYWINCSGCDAAMKPGMLFA